MILLALFACTSDTPEIQDSVSQADITFYADVKPVLDVHCTRCHFESGLGTGDFTDPDTVQSFAEVMLAQVDAGLMPPPVSDPACHDYVGSDQLTMDDGEKQILADWIDQGKVMGDPAEDPHLVPLSGELSDPDMELLMPAAYTPTWWDTENPGNEYRCFVLDPGMDEDFYVTALAPIVDNETLIHHEVLFTLKRDDLSADQLDPSGWDCMNNSGMETSMVAAWAPGALPIEFPQGTGTKIGSDQVLVLQMHYFQSGAETLPDRSGYALRTADSVDTKVQIFPMGLYDFDIPAGDADYTSEGSFYNEYPVTISVHGTFPHMHVLGQRYRASITHADGTETCLAEGEYDFNNQLTYQYEGELPVVATGDTVQYSCSWNNSESNPELPWDEPVDTRYGERTDEEMCFFFTLVSW